VAATADPPRRRAKADAIAIQCLVKRIPHMKI
jgi:hypothetical protein